VSAPRPKRMSRHDRLKRDAKLQRANERDRERAVFQAKRRARPRLAPALEELLQARAGGRCECCGNALRGRCQRHHRKLRSQGGLDQAANLVVICANCHNMIHNNDTWSRAHGWIVSAYRNPASVPITLHDDRRVRLTNTGGYELVAA